MATTPATTLRPTGTTTSRRRRVQTLDHLDDAEMNDVVNRMFGNSEDDSLSELMPWKDVWQCDETRDSGAMFRSATRTPFLANLHRSALKSRTNHGDLTFNTPSDKRGAGKLGSLYDPVFNPNEFIESAKKPRERA